MSTFIVLMRATVSPQAEPARSAQPAGGVQRRMMRGYTV